MTMKSWFMTLKIRNKIYIFHTNTIQIPDIAWDYRIAQLRTEVDQVHEIHYIPDLTDRSIDEETYPDGYFMEMVDFLFEIYKNGYKNIFIHKIPDGKKNLALRSRLSNELVHRLVEINDIDSKTIDKDSLGRFKLCCAEKYIYLSTFGGWNNVKYNYVASTVPAYLVTVDPALGYVIYRIDYLINPRQVEYNWKHTLIQFEALHDGSFQAGGWLYSICRVNNNIEFNKFNKMGVYIRKINISELRYLPLREFSIIGRDNYLNK